MINDARSYASLSSGLLARKGAAKPAMRPQGFGHHAGFDDLGWNDMGGQHHEPAVEEGFEGDLPEHVPSSIAALTPAPKLAKTAPDEVEEQAEPEVVAQQRAIAESFPPEVEAALGAADRDRGARRFARDHPRTRSAGRAGTPRHGEAKLNPGRAET